MNVLAIGNSFSEDATRYLHNIARADGENIQVVSLYIGGCSLERHYRNMLSGKDVYELQYNGEKTGFYVSLEDALLNRNWDVITLQQASLLSFVKDSYEPYISSLVAFVKDCVPKAKIYFHQTWAYEDGSHKLLNQAKYESAENMLKDIVNVSKDIAEGIGADGIIRGGETLGLLSQKGITGIHRDTFHASLGLGRYALGLIWYRTLTGRSVITNSFCDLDEPVSEDIIRVVKESVESLF